MSRISVAEPAPCSSLQQLASELLAAADLRRALDSTTVPAIIHDTQHIVHANRGSARWLGYEPRDLLVGADLRVLCAEEDQRSLLAALGAGSRALPDSAHVQRFAHLDATPLIANVLVRPAELEQQPVILALLEPLSTAQRSPTLLRLLEEAVDHLHDIVFITEAEAIDDVGRRIVFVNRIFTLITGYEATDVLGKTPSITIGELTDRRALARIEASLRQRRPVHEELLKYGKHGDEYWVELDILPVYDERGQHTHWVSVQRDITERRLLASKFVENERLASIGLLSARLAEELKSPVHAARASLDRLADCLPTLVTGAAGGDENAANLMQALQQARANTAAVEEVAERLQLLAGSPHQARGPTDVREILDAAIALLETARPIPGRIQRDYESVPPILADPSRLAQVFRFALEHAAASLLHERRETNTIRVRVRGLSDSVLVAIEDTGVGVSSEIAELLFTPFGNRGQRSERGFCLFIANYLVRELGGRIDVRACEHAGSLVEIVLPEGALPSALGPPATQ